MKQKILLFFAVGFFSLGLYGQDSPFQSAPGSAPPPQGWTRESDPQGGIHLPKSKPKYRGHIRPGQESAKPQSSPTPKN